MSSTDILLAISGNMIQKLNANRLGRVMADLGYQRMRYHGERGYVVVRYSSEEIMARQRKKAYEAEPDG